MYTITVNGNKKTVQVYIPAEVYKIFIQAATVGLEGADETIAPAETLDTVHEILGIFETV